MPATENNRRNLAEPTLENPSLPDHNRAEDEGMHAAVPTEMLDIEETHVGNVIEGDIDSDGSLDEKSIAPPDQAFEQMLEAGTPGNNGRIPEDPNNWLTSEPDRGYVEGNPEDRGESLVDDLQGDKH